MGFTKLLLFIIIAKSSSVQASKEITANQHLTKDYKYFPHLGGVVQRYFEPTNVKNLVANFKSSNVDLHRHKDADFRKITYRPLHKKIKPAFLKFDPNIRFKDKRHLVQRSIPKPPEIVDYPHEDDLNNSEVFSDVNTKGLSEKDSELLKIIHSVKIGYKIPIPVGAGLHGSAGIYRGHLDEGKPDDILHHEPIPFFGPNVNPKYVPKELVNQIRLQSDSYGPSFNPLYKEKFHGFLPVKLGPEQQYIEFPIEMYKTRFDPVDVSDNVYVNHQLGVAQKSGHVFPVKGKKSVFGYTRSARFIGNLLYH